MTSADEIVCIVDRDDNVVDQVPRRVMRAQALRHRVTYILVFNAAGELFVQLRTQSKDLYPGYYDLAAGGVVCAGESYEASAVREAEEELGIRDTPLQAQFKFNFEQDDNRSWGMVYVCVHEGPFALQEEEVAAGEFVSTRRVLEGTVEPVTPDSLAVFREYMDRRG